MKLYATLFLAASSIFVACSSNDEKAPTGVLNKPSDIEVVRSGANSVTVTWSDNSDVEQGFQICIRESDNPTFTQVAEVAADVTTATLTDVLKEGKAYFVGVRAYNKTEQTRLTSVLFEMAVWADLPRVTVANMNSAPNCIYANYTVANINGQSNVEWGLCWSTEREPLCTDDHAQGPQLAANGTVFQVIPNTLLDFKTEYNVRAYLKTASGVWYSDNYKASMSTDYPAITLQWNKLSTPSIPAEIEVYETTSTLNDDKFHAWYAIADVKGNVEFRVSVPSATATIDEQSASFNGDCYVMVNGGYFYNGRNTGLSVVNGTAAGSISEVRGSLRTGEDEYDVMYAVTRGCFGVDANGNADAYWASTDSKGVPSYYKTPLATVKGENKYAGTSSTIPSTPANWAPKYALSAGPMLLCDGVVPFNFATTSKAGEYYLTNYEIMPYDIFGPDVTPDRTAVGVREDGKVILFICDGRIAASDGANLLELAQIMKGLGCVNAVNFDGGGSTGMMVGNKHINDVTPNNRPVVSTIGFFKKK